MLLRAVANQYFAEARKFFSKYDNKSKYQQLLEVLPDCNKKCKTIVSWLHLWRIKKTCFHKLLETPQHPSTKLQGKQIFLSESEHRGTLNHDYKTNYYKSLQVQEDCDRRIEFGKLLKHNEMASHCFYEN